MNVLFEEDGAFKAGSVLADNTTSLQVEANSGRRLKVKAANVLLRFAAPAPAELLTEAQRIAQTLEADFLWESSGEAEFGFEDLAREYFGHAPAAIEAAAMLLGLHAAPMYFHRKGKGRFRKAPQEILQAALAGQEKKRQQAITIERMAGELKAGTLPAQFSPVLKSLLYKPDRNRAETKALEQACAETGLGAVHLLARCGAIPSSHDYHFGRFLFEFFPQGECPDTIEVPRVPDDLPRAPVQAFSIDDAATTEIDDAFSVMRVEEGGWRIGIHIAAPGLGIRPDMALGALARSRLSTVYMPGRKLTMLPAQVVERFTLAAGRDCPALSLYLDIDADFAIRAASSRIECVPVVANLRLHELEPVFNEDTLAAGLPDCPFREEFKVLWAFAGVLEAGRLAAKDVQRQSGTEYTFRVDWSEPEGRIDIVARRRGSPLDTLVAEPMIAANATWGKQLAEAQVAAIYRVQNGGKVRMTTAALSHEGLGVDCYAWASSPLRRYVDLINQWQLLALVAGERPPFTVRSAELLAAMRDFELTYAAYAEFQRHMERYWCLRWLQQEGVTEVEARVLRESLVRLDRIPLVLRCPSLPACEPGTRVKIGITQIDLLANEVQCRHLTTLESPVASCEMAEGAEDGMIQG